MATERSDPIHEPSGSLDERQPLWKRLLLSPGSNYVTVVLITAVFTGIALTTTVDALRILAWVAVAINIVAAVIQIVTERRRKASKQAEAGSIDVGDMPH